MSATMTAPRRTVLRYHGGKWRLAPWIISHFPAHRVYVEPFGGAASVLLQKPKRQAYAEVYNDLDRQVVNVFRVLRNPSDAAELEGRIRLTPYSRDEFTMSYEPSDDPIEQARRTIARSLMGFGSPSTSGHNTGFRSNSNRTNTTPAHDWANYPNAIRTFVERLQGVVIENRDAIQVIEQHDSTSTLFYADPPYPASTRNRGNPYSAKGYRHEMTDDDHRRLAATLHSASGMVVISGYPCDLYDDELYLTWRRITRSAMADGARERTEVLWISPNAERHMPQRRLL